MTTGSTVESDTVSARHHVRGDEILIGESMWARSKWDEMATVMACPSCGAERGQTPVWGKAYPVAVCLPVQDDCR